jgi:membrane dipeptidase
MRSLRFVTLSAILTIIGCGVMGQEFTNIHNNALVADLHCDTAMRMVDGFDFSQVDTTGDVDLPRLMQGGVDLQVFACFVRSNTPVDQCRATVDTMLDSLQTQIARNSDKIQVCRTAAEAEKIIGEDKIAAFLGIENGVAIANDLENLQHFYDRGVRYMTLTHTSSNDWCISSADQNPAFDGLTDFGRDVVRKMNELGMIIDVSHAAPSTVSEVLKVTSDPIIASHSCVYSICPHDRNLTDNQIKAIAENGGVIGINFYKGYLSKRYLEIVDSVEALHRDEIDSVEALYPDSYEDRHKALSHIYREMREAVAPLKIDVGTVVDHIDYIVKLVGPEYVGLGSDFDGVWSLPDGLTDCSMMPNITKELLVRGYSKQDIEKILGGNFMRVFRQVCDAHYASFSERM